MERDTVRIRTIERTSSSSETRDNIVAAIPTIMNVPERRSLSHRVGPKDPVVAQASWRYRDAQSDTIQKIAQRYTPDIFLNNVH